MLKKIVPNFENLIPRNNGQILLQGIWICILFCRLSDKEEERPEVYKKRSDDAMKCAQIFQYKYCALAFLRAKKKWSKFKLHSNLERFGVFGDVVLEYPDGKLHICMQIKSGAIGLITLSRLMNKNSPFSLCTYYNSYINAQEALFGSKEGDKMDRKPGESLFIIYTNADIESSLNSDEVTGIVEEEFLMTRRFVLQFNEGKHEAIYQYLQEMPEHREFLSRLRIVYSQAKEKQMEFDIKSELQQSMKLPDSELDLAYECYRDIIKDRWQNCIYSLQEPSCMENDPIRKTADKLRTILVTKIRELDQRKSELDDLMSALNIKSPQ